jgi:hypothetical protein
MALELGYNSFVERTEANEYFADRFSATAWDNATDANKDKALIAASRMINKESFVGSVSSATQAMAFPRTGTFNDDRSGMRITLDDDFSWSSTKWTSSTDSYHVWFSGLPLEYRYLKISVYEQAFWFLLDTDIINEYSATSTSSSAGDESSYKVGSLEVTTKGASASSSSQTRRTNPTYFVNLRPILVRGGRNSAWFRSN